jgi:hypothetical protein
MTEGVSKSLARRIGVRLGPTSGMRDKIAHQSGDQLVIVRTETIRIGKADKPTIKTFIPFIGEEQLRACVTAEEAIACCRRGMKVTQREDEGEYELHPEALASGEIW